MIKRLLRSLIEVVDDRPRSLEAEVKRQQFEIARLTGELEEVQPQAAHLATELAGARRENTDLRLKLDETVAHHSRCRYLLRQATPGGIQPRQFVFLHIQKTGGISLLELFSRWFSYLRTAWVFSPGELDSYEPAELAHYDFVCGHFTARNLAQVRPGAFICTFLRDPVERVVSSYWYFRGYEGQTRPATRAAVAAAKVKSFADFLDDPDPEVRWHLDNHQCHAMTGDWTSPRSLSTDDLSVLAIGALERFDLVGISDMMEISLQLLYCLSERDEPGELGRLNTTPHRPRVEDMNSRERERVLELNAADIRLYQAAREKLVARAALTRKAA